MGFASKTPYDAEKAKKLIVDEGHGIDEVKGLLEGDYTARRLDELRNSLPDKYQVIDSYGNKIGNIAYSFSAIEGYSIEELKSFSKYGSKGKNGVKNKVNGWVSSVDNPKETLIK